MATITILNFSKLILPKAELSTTSSINTGGCSVCKGCAKT